MKRFGYQPERCPVLILLKPLSYIGFCYILNANDSRFARKLTIPKITFAMSRTTAGGGRFQLSPAKPTSRRNRPCAVEPAKRKVTLSKRGVAGG
jgi:hypothetical protein